MRTGRGFERLVNFSDAVIAIAMTLLVLPLVDIPGELQAGETMADVLSEHRSEFAAFVLSFLVIWTLWTAHHRIMEHFRGYDDVLMRWHMLFLFTLISLPFSTQLLGAESNDQAAPFYICTLLVTSLSLLGISLRGRKKPDLLHADRPEVQQWLARPASWYNPAVLSFALVISIFWSTWGLWALLLLILDNIFDRIIGKLRGRSGVDPE